MSLLDRPALLEAVAMASNSFRCRARLDSVICWHQVILHGVALCLQMKPAIPQERLMADLSRGFSISRNPCADRYIVRMR